MDTVERLQLEDLEPALERLLALPGGGPVSPAAVHGFLAGLLASSATWRGWRCGPARSPSAVVLAMLTPGSAALMVPSPGELGIQADVQHELTVEVLGELGREGLRFAQVIVAPESLALRDLLKRVGFRHLTLLEYRQRTVAFPWADPPDLPGADWRTYGPDTEALFLETVRQTYRESLDCPELSALRSVTEALAAHRALGRFDPDLWEVVLIEGRPAGCLLLTELVDGRTAEVVYMGVTPVFRGRGVGGQLLRRALQRCRERGLKYLVLAVDDRNTPAKQLYGRFALEPVAWREVMLYRWPRRGA